MEWNWNYGNQVLTLPASALSADATETEYRVLLWLASDLSLAGKPLQLAKLAGCTKAEAERALGTWAERGVLQKGEGPAQEKPAGGEKATKQTGRSAAGKPAEDKPVQKLARADEIPNYSSRELADMLERKQSLRALVDESQKILGKIFNTYEVNILLGMVDYLQLGEDYILLLLAHCKRIEKTSLRMIERYAISLSDRGVRTAGDLEARIQQIEQAHTLEGQVRAMFGIGNRSLITKEKNAIAAWSDYGYGEDVVRRAYEITVAKTKEAKIDYANAILERWHAEGLLTAEAIDRKIAEEKVAREGAGDAATLGNSFDTDDFFEAALQRSFRKPEKPENA